MNYRNPELVPVPVFPWSPAPPHSLWWSPGKTCSWQSDWCWWRCRRWPSQRRRTSCPASPSSWSDQTWSLVSAWQQPGRCFCLWCHCWRTESLFVSQRVSVAELRILLTWNLSVFIPVSKTEVLFTTCCKRLWTWILLCKVQRFSSWWACTPEAQLPAGEGKC